jgi:pimeloyl-ACP methyl ester carboxylesterase
MPGLSRRKLLLGGIGVAAAACAGGYELVQAGTLPGKYALDQLLGSCGSAPPPPAGPLPSLHSISFYSAYRQQAVQMIIVAPAGVRPHGLSAVVALHGSGSNAARMAAQVRPALARSGVRHFTIICVDGGETYWHKRADGDDPAGMIAHEVLPRAAAAGLRTSRLGITGLSAGSYGALLLGEQLSPAAVAALSPAIFATYGDARAANPHAFDSAADFARNDVFTEVAALRNVPTWVACGTDDPFEPEVAKLRAELAAAKGHQVPGGLLAGCHDDAFWLRNMPAALQFIGAQLS